MCKYCLLSSIFSVKNFRWPLKINLKLISLQIWCLYLRFKFLSIVVFWVPSIGVVLHKVGSNCTCFYLLFLCLKEKPHDILSIKILAEMLATCTFRYHVNISFKGLIWSFHVSDVWMRIKKLREVPDMYILKLIAGWDRTDCKILIDFIQNSYLDTSNHNI